VKCKARTTTGSAWCGGGGGRGGRCGRIVGCGGGCGSVGGGERCSKRLTIKANSMDKYL